MKVILSDENYMGSLSPNNAHDIDHVFRIADSCFPPATSESNHDVDIVDRYPIPGSASRRGVAFSTHDPFNGLGVRVGGCEPAGFHRSQPAATPGLGGPGSFPAIRRISTPPHDRTDSRPGSPSPPSVWTVLRPGSPLRWGEEPRPPEAGV